LLLAVHAERLGPFRLRAREGPHIHRVPFRSLLQTLLELYRRGADMSLWLTWRFAPNTLLGGGPGHGRLHLGR
jgi:hypothetical protein